MDPLGGRGPLTWVLFGKNVCKNERIWSHRGRAPDTPPRSANVLRYDSEYSSMTGTKFHNPNYWQLEVFVYIRHGHDLLICK